MKVYNLCCEQNHTFEGWFASKQDFDIQMTQDQILCPICQSVKIKKLLSAPRVNRSVTEVVSKNSMEQQQKLWLTLVHHIVAQTDDVGSQFAEEARRIHYQEVPERGIRGTATVDECEALLDEGIEIAGLPIPEIFKQPLQ